MEVPQTGVSSSEQHSSPHSSLYEAAGDIIDVGSEDDIANLRLAD
jgi:hypothetical protein